MKKLLQKIRLNYFLIPLLIVITGSAASYFAQTGRVWYKTINLPIWIWTPSNTLMLAAWAVIFILSSFAVLIVWNRYSEQKNFRLIMTLFILNAVINIGWYILFFGHQQLGLAFFQAVIFSTILTLNVWLMN